MLGAVEKVFRLKEEKLPDRLDVDDLDTLAWSGELGRKYEFMALSSLAESCTNSRGILAVDGPAICSKCGFEACSAG